MEDIPEDSYLTKPQFWELKSTVEDTRTEMSEHAKLIEELELSLLSRITEREKIAEERRTKQIKII